MIKKIKPQKVNESQRLKAHSSSDILPDREPPAFCLKYIRNGFNLSDCERNEKAQFANTLHKLSQRTWAELRQAPRLGLGYEKISRNSLKVDPPSNITPDNDIIAFRCIGRAPMVGFKTGRIFHIVWIDRRFTVYGH